MSDDLFCSVPFPCHHSPFDWASEPNSTTGLVYRGQVSGRANNVLDGGLGTDTLIGGDGNDTYVVDNVQSTVSYSLSANIENLTLIGFSSINGTGNELNNVVVGNEGANILRGEAGNDVVSGGVGNDTLIGGTGSDTYLFNLGDGVDTIDDVALPGEGNVVVFGAGITRSALSLSAGSVIIHAGTGGDQLHLLNSILTDPTGPHAVDVFRFADGTALTYAELLTGSTTNHAPTVANPLADQTVLEDASFSIPVPANTFADEDVGDTLIYSATLANGTALPTWLTFNPTTRTFSGTPQNGDVGNLSIAVKVTDTGGLSATSNFTLTVQNVNDAPVVATPLMNQTVLEDAPLSIQVPANTFADPDTIYGGDTLTYSATLANGTALPSWLSFNPTTRIFMGAPDDAQVGTLNLAVTATDSDGLSASSSIALTVQNVNEAPVVATPLTNQTTLEDAPFGFTVPANTCTDQDEIHGDTLTYCATLQNGAALPAWMSFNPTTRTFSGMPLNGDVGNLTITVTATDVGG